MQNKQKINLPKLGAKLNEQMERQIVEKEPDFDFRLITPLKEACVNIFKDIHQNLDQSSEEIILFKKVLKKISGIITTNYDLILEELTRDLDFESFIGQCSLINKNLVFSEEIYKIHGCVTERESIIITENDYKIFNSRQKYILGKLTVIFVEFPLIFIGYSIDDDNIKNILNDLMISLTYEELKKVTEKWLFIEYKKDEENLLLNERRIEFENGQRIIFNCIETDNFTELYNKLLNINYKLNPQKKTIKYIKKIIAEYELQPNSKIFVQAADSIDEVINAFKEGKQVSLSFGSTKEFLGLNSYDLIKDLILDNNLNYNVQTNGFINEFKNNIKGKYFPRYKYFNSEARTLYGISNIEFEDIKWEGVITKNVDDSYKNSNDLSKQIQYWAKEIVENSDFNFTEFTNFLKYIFNECNSFDEIYSKFKIKSATSLKKLITVFDIIKYKN